ncbi:MAG: hypothetical protein IPL87_05205 [Candidatus Moraniibacteriota bacterium]|nr:MAG: hypothetical protein IPL87_05205 [Candidatus Moranbacteria bacterium]
MNETTGTETPNHEKERETVSESPALPLSKDVEDHRFVAALSYLCVLVFIPLFLKRESPYCQFHAKQGVALLVVWILGSFVFWFPILGWGLAVFVFVLNVLGFVKALQGERWDMPLVSGIAKKLNL